MPYFLYRLIQHIPHISAGSGSGTNYPSLSGQRENSGATGNGTLGYALVAGGGRDTGIYSTVEKYNITSGGSAGWGGLRRVLHHHDGCSNTTLQKAIWCSGRTGSTPVNDVDQQSIASSSTSSAWGTLRRAKYGVCAVSNGIGNKALIAGGYNSGRFSEIDTMGINTGGAYTHFGNLISARDQLFGASNAD